MLVLFLDTETTSLFPSDGQIIELAGIVAEFDPAGLTFKAKEKFVTLVKLRSSMEDKTTRLTGITEEDLALAPSLPQAQDQWADWLEKFGNQIQVIAGHSPEFDLAFLNKESWFLPENTKLMDTCGLAKILLPQVAAVNLEHLIQKLGLEVKLADSAQTEEAHRALFDTQASLKLGEKLLQILSCQAVHPEFKEYLVEHFLPLPIELFGQVQLPPPGPIEPKAEYEIYNWQGQLQGHALLDKLNQLSGLDLELSIKFFSLKIEPEWMKLVIAQMYYLVLIKSQNPQWQLRLHGHSHKCFLFGELLADFLLRKKISTDGQLVSGVLESFEQLIPVTRYLVEETFDVGHLVLWLEIYQALESELDEEISSAIQKLISSYDFLLIALQPFWIKSEYHYNSYSPQPMEQAVYLKFAELAKRLNELRSFDLPANNELSKLVVERVLGLWPESEITSAGRMSFRYFRDNLSLGKIKPDFNLRDYFNNLIQVKNISQVQTFLQPEDFEHLRFLSSLDKSWPTGIEVKYLTTDQKPEIVDTIRLEEFLQQQTEVAQSTGRPVLVLAGQNSGLKDAQKILTEKFIPKTYLTLGESGSLTKIASKIIHGFVGVVVVKSGDFGYLSKIKEMPEIGQIWLLCKPYVYIHPYWQSLGYDGTRILQDLHFRGQLNYISTKAGTKMGYVKSYGI
jgi:DNA polymerase III epsilon subunit-like protein